MDPLSSHEPPPLSAPPFDVITMPLAGHKADPFPLDDKRTRGASHARDENLEPATNALLACGEGYESLEAEAAQIEHFVDAIRDPPNQTDFSLSSRARARSPLSPFHLPSSPAHSDIAPISPSLQHTSVAMSHAQSLKPASSIVGFIPLGLGPQGLQSPRSPAGQPPSEAARIDVNDGATGVRTADVESSIEDINTETLQLWLRRAKRKFYKGVCVIKVSPKGKLAKRHFYIGAKPNYLEIVSSKLFDMAYHLAEVVSAHHGVDSPDFEAYRRVESQRLPKSEKSLIIQLTEDTPGPKVLSLVFLSEEDRRDAQFLLRVQSRALREQIQAAENRRSLEMEGGGRAEVGDGANGEQTPGSVSVYGATRSLQPASGHIPLF